MGYDDIDLPEDQADYLKGAYFRSQPTGLRRQQPAGNSIMGYGQRRFARDAMYPRQQGYGGRRSQGTAYRTPRTSSADLDQIGRAEAYASQHGQGGSRYVQQQEDKPPELTETTTDELSPEDRSSPYGSTFEKSAGAALTADTIEPDPTISKNPYADPNSGVTTQKSDYKQLPGGTMQTVDTSRLKQLKANLDRFDSDYEPSSWKSWLAGGPGEVAVRRSLLERQYAEEAARVNAAAGMTQPRYSQGSQYGQPGRYREDPATGSRQFIPDVEPDVMAKAKSAYVAGLGQPKGTAHYATTVGQTGRPQMVSVTGGTATTVTTPTPGAPSAGVTGPQPESVVNPVPVEPYEKPVKEAATKALHWEKDADGNLQAYDAETGAPVGRARSGYGEKQSPKEKEDAALRAEELKGIRQDIRELNVELRKADNEDDRSKIRAELARAHLRENKIVKGGQGPNVWPDNAPAQGGAAAPPTPSPAATPAPTAGVTKKGFKYKKVG